MPCPISYIRQPSKEDILNTRRNEVLSQIEQELATNTAVVEVDPITGQTKVVGASEWPEGMSDLCVLAALQDRNSLEWQLAAAHAGVQEQSFIAAHSHMHAHGHTH